MFRLLLLLPAGLVAAIWIAPPLRSAVLAGQFPSPELLHDFVKHFVLITWWLGAVAAASLLWRRGHRKTDLAYGLVAGAIAGLVGSATLACLLPGLDWLPRLLWHQVQNATGPTFLLTPLWIALAAASWAFWGAVVAFALNRSGRFGTRLLSRVTNALGWLFRFCGLKRASAFFVPP
jgi:hypothetical protein